jgi:tripartite-type tricarboxylate transporter receptor subunit TctC
MLRRTLLLAPLATLPGLPAATRAQAAWPDRPMRWILPDAPGSGNDITARLLQPLLDAALGQPTVIENRAGAGGRIGVEAAFRAAPDGYTFLLGNAGSNGINAAIYRDLPFDLTTAFEPISLLVTGPNVLTVNAKAVPVNTVAELIAFVKARPGQLNYGSGGVGSSAHMSTELLKYRAGLDMQHIPYRGTQAMAQGAISGDSPVLLGNLVNLMPFIQRGELKALAVTSRTRSRFLPEVPTMIEAGVPDFETIAWNGLLAPKGTPTPILARMHAELVKLKGNAMVNERVAALGGELVVSSPEAFAAQIRGDIAKWKDLAERVNIRAE